MIGETWRLYDHADRELATLIVTDADFPWLTARCEATPAFAPLRALFAEELALTDVAAQAVADWERAYRRIRASVRLAAPDGVRVPEFLLHIDGDVAWWRWSDEPFDDD